MAVKNFHDMDEYFDRKKALTISIQVVFQKYYKERFLNFYFKLN